MASIAPEEQLKCKIVLPTPHVPAQETLILHVMPDIIAMAHNVLQHLLDVTVRQGQHLKHHVLLVHIQLTHPDAMKLQIVKHVA